MDGVIYYNPSLSHQVDHAKAFKSCGFHATPALHEPPTDVCVISGPHYAYEAMKHHPRVLMIDRAWWGDPDCVSIGWLQPDGTRKFAKGEAERPKPDMMMWKPNLWPTFGELSCLVLAQYGEDVSGIVAEAKERFIQVNVREHPADHKSVIPLDMQVKWYDCVMGAGTAIFEAIRCGIPTICTDPTDECAPVCSDSVGAELYRGNRAEWLHDMSYKQWSLDEIASGEAWEYLRDV
jgi:hypothetical protein